jgi:broad specificity phosphatase PhoE
MRSSLPSGYTKCTMTDFGAALSSILEPLVALVLVLFVLLALLRIRTRRFYFVRHGQTMKNAEHVRQGEDGALSERGRAQAENVAKELKRFPIDRIITSSYPRAKETAQILAKELHVPVLVSALFRERKNPSEIIGKPTDDPEVMSIVDKIDLSYHEDDYRYSDEENFADLKKRARECLALLERQGSNETVIVTHHAFLKACIAYLLYRESLHAGDFVKLSYFNVSDNAGVTICEYNPWKRFNKTRGWSVLSFNEQP